jgi:CRP/FNR family transcriptional regulator
MGSSSDARHTLVIAFLRKHSYFTSVSDEGLTTLVEKAKRHSFTGEQLLFLEAERSAGLWIIESGRVKVFKTTTEGREHILHLLGPGDTFNDIPALDGRPNAASAMTISDAAIWVVPSAAIRHALESNHELALAVIDALTTRVRHLVVQIEDLALRSITARLARFLLEQAETPALRHPAVTRALIATYLATTPETVSRALRTLEETGAIAFDRHRIVISRPELLREIAML